MARTKNPVLITAKPHVITGGKSRCGRSHWRRRRANILGIGKRGLRRFARRGGVHRTSRSIYGDMRGALKIFLEGVIRDAALYTQQGYRMTVTYLDVVYALKRNGMTLYGFGG
ncbi:hypothetical protein B0H13DRAFT_1907396 [Mycena leptocephala]|nr:hypothetical protein B0H13DRAFT_1907396 [Mycena leptocephala]